MVELDNYLKQHWNFLEFIRKLLENYIFLQSVGEVSSITELSGNALKLSKTALEVSRTTLKALRVSRSDLKVSKKLNFRDKLLSKLVELKKFLDQHWNFLQFL